MHDLPGVSEAQRNGTNNHTDAPLDSTSGGAF